MECSTPGYAMSTEPIAEQRTVARFQPFVSFLARYFEHATARIGVAILAFFLVLAIIPNILVGPLESAATASGDFLARPNASHLLGTDEIGRDVLNLVVHGARVSLTIALIATV